MSKNTLALLKECLDLVDEGFALDDNDKLVIVNKEKVAESDKKFHRFCLEKSYEIYEAASVQENDAELAAMADEIKFEELGAHASQMRTDTAPAGKPATAAAASPAPAAPPAAAGLPESSDFESLFSENVEEFDLSKLFEFDPNNPEEQIPQDDGMGGMADPAGLDAAAPAAGPEEMDAGMEPVAGDGMGDDAGLGGDPAAADMGAPVDDLGGDDMGGLADGEGHGTLKLDGHTFDFDFNLTDALGDDGSDPLAAPAGDDLGAPADDLGADAPVEEPMDDLGAEPAMGGAPEEEEPKFESEAPVAEGKGGKMNIVPANRRASGAKPMGKK